MLISSFQILTCCSCALMRTKLMKKLNRNPTEGEDSTQCLEISSQITIKKTRMDWQVLETFCQRETSEYIDSDKKLTFTSFFTICSVFFLQKPTKERWKRQKTGTMSNFQNAPALKWPAKTYIALSFDRINFFNMVHLISLSRKPLLCAVVLVSH